MRLPDELLILAPRGRDSLVIQQQLAAGGITAAVASAANIVSALVAGTLGMAIIADEAMAEFDLEALTAALAVQAPWSDCPFLLLTKRDFGGWTRARITALLGNVTVLERPLSSDALISSVRSAVRARVRQRGAEAYLQSREEAEAQVRSLAVTLEARVEARTRELTQALAVQARVQQDLKDSEELYRLAIELGSLVPWSAGPDGVLIAVGTRLDELLGMETAPLLKDWLDGVHPHDVERIVSAWQAAVSCAHPFNAELRLKTAAGTHTWFRARAAPLLAGGKVLRWHGTLEDIDQQRRAEGRLQEVQTELAEVSRLSAMGAMASILAHELNQPLTAIGNYVRAGRRMLEAGSQVDTVIAALGEADRSTVRAGEIVRRARDLVSGASVGRSLQPLAALIDEAQDLAFDGSRWVGIRRYMRLDPAITTVLVDKIQMQQVLINLIRNAAEAMADSESRELSIQSAEFADEYCVISVGDTGPGVAADVAEHLFDPFNSTKAEGMGIGLSISRTIVEAHGGKIWCHPRPGGGTVFSFTVQRG